MKRPTLPELVSVQQQDGTQLRVTDHIYSPLTHKQVLDFGYKLLNDDICVRRIVREHGNNAEMIIHDIFKNWLAGDDGNQVDPALPRAWWHLARCLEETNVELGVLALEI